MVLHLATAKCATVCYMAETNERARVGIRELRQNLSIYIDRVKDGETLEVTEHGQVVGQLGPVVRERGSLIDEMIADGRITPAAKSIHVWPEPVPLPPGVKSVTETLLQMRDEETY
jgi:prevent-host-death family protein